MIATQDLYPHHCSRSVVRAERSASLHTSRGAGEEQPSTSQMNAVFWVWDLGADRVTFVSPTYEDVFGRSSASLYADRSSVLGAIHPDDRDRIEAVVRRLRDGTPTDEQYRVVRPDGSMRWVRDRAMPVPEPEGPIRRVIGVADDITDRKDADEALQRSERLLRLVLDALPVGVVVMDWSGDIILSNPASERIWAGTMRSGCERYAQSKGWWHDTGEMLEREDWGSVRALSTGENLVSTRRWTSRRSMGRERPSTTRRCRFGTRRVPSPARSSSTKRSRPASRPSAPSRTPTTRCAPSRAG